MTYVPPVAEMRFILEEICGLDQLAALPGLEDADPETVGAILEEAGKFAADVLAPLNRAGDLAGLGFAQGAVTTPAGWKEAYAQLTAMGWNAPSAAPGHGGMGLPDAVNACIQEMFQGANASFQLCPMLTQGAIEAVEAYAADALKSVYLDKMASGEWTGAMNLTEPQAGSDLAAIRSRAEPAADGSFRLFGQKIFITYGEHDLTDNIVHLVLARLPEAPAGVKGISLFLVPKILPDGSRNDLRCVSLEHKLGIHASPTCTLAFGDAGGAVGWIIGEPNKGLPYMFAMMNNARLNVGLQGVGIAEHAFQHAAAYAAERRQGGAPGHEGPAPIVAHGDVRRMLGLMKARTRAARILALLAARSADIARRADDAETRAFHQRRLDLLIPVVKGWSTEMAVETASLGVQVHGGMGFVEETGAAQHLRDARITTIYEGTTGIQALDLVGRKILRDGGEAARELVADIEADLSGYGAGMSAETAAVLSGMIAEAAELVSDVTDLLARRSNEAPAAPAAGAFGALEVFGVGLGGWALAVYAGRAAARIAAGEGGAHLDGAARLALFYAAHAMPRARAALRTLDEGAAATLALSAEDLGAAA